MGLSHWVSDDGTLGVHKNASGDILFSNFVFCTQSFDDADIELLVQKLGELKIEGILYVFRSLRNVERFKFFYFKAFPKRVGDSKKGKAQYVIRLRQQDFLHMAEMTMPFTIPIMRYKLRIEERDMAVIDATNANETDMSNLKKTYMWRDMAYCGMCGQDFNNSSGAAISQHINRHKKKFCTNCGINDDRLDRHHCNDLPMFVSNIQF